MLSQFFTKRSWVFFCIGAFLIPTYMWEIRLERHSKIFYPMRPPLHIGHDMQKWPQDKRTFWKTDQQLWFKSFVTKTE